MSKKAKTILMSIAGFMLALVFIEISFMFGRNDAGERYFAIYIPFAIMAGAIALTLCTAFGLYKNRDFFFKLGFMGGIIAVIAIAIYEAMVLTGITAMLNSGDNIAVFVKKMGIWAPIIYIFIQAAQVTLVPIPSTVTVIAGMIAFDHNLGLVVFYSTIGMIIGSMLAFALGRIFGVKLVVWLVGEKSYNKYQKIIKGRDKTMLFMMFLLPVFPDDLLCLIAGLTTMSYSTFFAMQIISRPIGIMMSSTFELFMQIPFEGWYILLWAILILAIVLMFVFVWKYSGKIEDKMVKMLLKRMNANSGTTIDKNVLKAQVINLVSDTQVVSSEPRQKRRRRKAANGKAEYESVEYRYYAEY